MPELPSDIHEDFPNKGDTFYTIAEIVLLHHGQQLTAGEIAEQVGPEKEAVRQHLKELEDKGWVDGFDGPKSYTWNTQEYNPTEHDAQEAVGVFSKQMLSLGRRAIRSPTETLAFATVIGIGIAIFMGASALLAIFLPVGPEISQTYALIGAGSVLGSIITYGAMVTHAKLLH